MTTQANVDTPNRAPDAQEIADYDHDPLVHKFGSARWGCELLDAIDWIKAHAAGFQLPLLMVHGADDRINLPRGIHRPGGGGGHPLPCKEAAEAARRGVGRVAL